MMPEARADEALVKRELEKAEAERAERLRLQEDLKRHEDERLAQAARRQKEEKLKQEEEAKRLEAEKLAQAQSLAQVQVSTAAMAMLADLQRRMDELEKREKALKAREVELAKAAAVAAAPDISDDIDLAPKGGLPQSDENFAVVIGVEKYRDIAAGADYAEKDARTVMLYLRDYLGFPERNIKLLTGDRASRSDFAKILELWLPLQVTPESKVFVYYSGHGAPDPNSQQAYLLPYDGDPKALELVPEEFARQHQIIPFGFDSSGALQVAMENPQDFEVINALSAMVRRTVRPHLPPISSRRRSIRRLSGQGHKEEAAPK